MRLTSALAVLAIATHLYGGDAPPTSQAPQRPTFINAKVSSKRVCLNEAVRVEFTTMPRDVENIDIASAVANAVRLGGAETWRLLGKPTVSEQLGTVSGANADPAKPVKERPKPITVVFSLLPRKAGDLPLPDVPVTWLQGNAVARFDTIVVAPQVMVGGTAKELPKEVYGVAGYTWGTALDSLKDKFTADQQVAAPGGRVEVKAQKHLVLGFSNGALADARLFAPGLGFDQARTSFLERWGIPQEDAGNELTWVLGWTRIGVTAATVNGAAGMQISLAREDIQADQAKTQVKADIFGVLEGPAKETPEEAEKRKAKEIQAELNRPEVPAK
jgi:hypothetical protein